MKRLACSLLFTVPLLVAATTGAAMADGGAPALGVRDGFMLGFGINAGEISCRGTGCEDVTEAAGLDLHFGTVFDPQMALAFDLWAMGHSEDDITITHTIATLGLQYWLLPRLWIKGGLGVAQAAWRYDGLIDLQDETEYVPAIMGGVGYEIVVGRNFALDVQLRGGTGYYRDDGQGTDVRAHNVAAGAGFTWF